MKTLKFISVILVVVSFLTTSCRKQDPKEEFAGETKPMSEINTGPDFSWETTKIIDVSLTTISTGVVYIKPVEGDFNFYKGMVSSGSGFTTEITVPSYIREVKLTFKCVVHVVSINGNRLDYNFK